MAYWPLADLPKAGQPTLLFVDGFESNSDSAHFVYAHKERLPDILHISAFSYGGVGQSYSKAQSRDLIDGIDQFPSFLPWERHRLVVPVAASGGAIVTLLGVAAWIRQMEVAPVVVRALVPRLILISPPFGLDRDVFAKAFGVDIVGTDKADTYPAFVTELVALGMGGYREWLFDVVSARGVLRWAGIQIRVLEWPGDSVTTTNWPEGVEEAMQPVERKPLPLNGAAIVRRDQIVAGDDKQAGDAARRAFLNHLRFIRCEAVTASVEEAVRDVWPQQMV